MIYWLLSTTKRHSTDSCVITLSWPATPPSTPSVFAQQRKIENNIDEIEHATARSIHLGWLHWEEGPWARGGDVYFQARWGACACCCAAAAFASVRIGQAKQAGKFKIHKPTHLLYNVSVLIVSLIMANFFLSDFAFFLKFKGMGNYHFNRVVVHLWPAYFVCQSRPQTAPISCAATLVQNWVPYVIQKMWNFRLTPNNPGISLYQNVCQISSNNLCWWFLGVKIFSKLRAMASVTV